MLLVIISNLLLLSFSSGHSFLDNMPIRSLGVEKPSCVKEIKEFTVRGGSLTDLINAGEKVKILFGFYDCNEIKREDVVAYDYKGNSNLIIKAVKGLQGDEFSVESKEDDGWIIKINSRTVVNSKGEEYVLDEAEHKMLALYEKDYQGKIPPKTYLILGNLVNGSVDSSRFGLVSKDNILGKVLVTEGEK